MGDGRSHVDLIDAYRRQDRQAVHDFPDETMHCADSFMTELGASARNDLLYFDGAPEGSEL